MCFLLLVPGCEDRTQLAGKYISEESLNHETARINLELMANGQGIWATEEDNVSFRWETRENKILIHTKSGGVIVGKTDDQTIEIGLPGMDAQIFRKIRK